MNKLWSPGLRSSLGNRGEGQKREQRITLQWGISKSLLHEVRFGPCEKADFRPRKSLVELVWVGPRSVLCRHRQLVHRTPTLWRSRAHECDDKCYDDSAVLGHELQGGPSPPAGVWLLSQGSFQEAFPWNVLIGSHLV